MPTYATHEENSTVAHNLNHTCPFKWFVFAASQMPAKSTTQVLGPSPWATTLVRLHSADDDAAHDCTMFQWKQSQNKI